MPKDTTAQKGAPTNTRGYAEGRPIGGDTLGQKLPNFKLGLHGDRSRLFVYGAHHSSWEVVVTAEGARLVPVLKPLYVVPGCNGTRGGSSADVEAKARRLWGFDVLVNLREYLVEYPGAGHKGIFTRWERVKIYGDGAWDVKLDQAAFDAWRAELVTSGKVEPPRESVIAGLRRAAERRLQRAARREDSPLSRRALDSAEGHRKHLEEAIAALGTEAAA